MAIQEIIKERVLEKNKNVVKTEEKISNFEQQNKNDSLRTEKPKESHQYKEKINPVGVPLNTAIDSLLQKRSVAIDDILAEGLNDIFLKMDVKRQQEFKKKGEETVEKINLLLSRSKVKIGKIIDLIKAWLKLIPGINKFFVEQEAKIKADKILNIKDKL